MTAILLAAGIGRRMGPAAAPKCLLQIGGISLLQRTLETLRMVGVQEAVLVLGYGREQVAQVARRHAGRMRLTLLENSRYAEGAILSLWTARAFLDRPVVVMDTDVLYPPAVLERLIRSPQRNCLLVDRSVPDSGEEQMVFGGDGRVLQITKRPSEALRRQMELFGESVGFLKLSREAAAVLRELLEAKVRQGEVSIEHEEVYPALFSRVPVGCESVGEAPWLEIDTPEDARRAAEEVYPRWVVPPCLNRRISRFFFPAVVKLPITPNQWTFLGLLAGWGALLCMAQGGYGWGWGGAFLFELFYIVDNWDGEVARAKGLASWWGGWWDVVVDMLVQVGLPLALAAGPIRTGAPDWLAWVAGVAALGLAMDMGVTALAKWRGFGPSVYSDPARGRTVSSGSALARWIRTNWTHENFSWLVVAVLAAEARGLFLVALAVGSHLFWMRFLWKERGRLLRTAGGASGFKRVAF